MERSTHPLKGLWLVRASLDEEGIDPFKSVMDLQDEVQAEAFSNIKMKRLTALSGEPISAKDKTYIQRRKQVEHWLEDSGARNGLISDGNPPLYFALRTEPQTTAPKGYTCINIPADMISPESLTFTMYDSFYNYEKLSGERYNRVERNATPYVYSTDEIAATLDKHGFPEHMKKGEHFIECQLWNRDQDIFNIIRDTIQTSDLKIITVDHDKHMNPDSYWQDWLNAQQLFEQATLSVV